MRKQILKSTDNSDNTEKIIYTCTIIVILGKSIDNDVLKYAV